MKKIKGENLHDYVNSNLENPPRQELPKLYIVNGAIYATRRNIFILENTFKGKKCGSSIMGCAERIIFKGGTYYSS